MHEMIKKKHFCHENALNNYQKVSICNKQFYAMFAFSEVVPNLSNSIVISYFTLKVTCFTKE